MSFFGGGTDMESFFRQYGGAVLSTTFDKYCYVNVRHLPPFFSYTSEFSYSKIERVPDVGRAFFLRVSTFSRSTRLLQNTALVILTILRDTTHRKSVLQKTRSLRPSDAVQGFGISQQAF